PNPFFNALQESGGTEKIFALFQKNADKFTKDRSALSIGYIYRNHEITDTVVRQEIINYLIAIINDNDSWIQDKASTALYYLAQDAVNRTQIFSDEQLQRIKQNDELRQRVISSGIVDEFLLIFTSRKLKSIPRIYSSIFTYLTFPASDLIRLMLYTKKPFPGLLRLLNYNVTANDAITSIFNILAAGSNSSLKTEKHPHLEDMQKCGYFKNIAQIIGTKFNKPP
ncbi:MAG: hypothetical protein EZS28_037207, partial [Streblomastix strix]